MTDVEWTCHTADVPVAPARREGLPTVAIGVSACGVPTFTSPVTGTADCIQSGVTGACEPQGDRRRFIEAFATGRTRDAGVAPAHLVGIRFDHEVVSQLLAEFLPARQEVRVK